MTLQARLNDLASALTIPLPAQDVSFQGVSTDSRKLIPGNLFVALKGPNFDGHDYLQAAKEKGAAAAIVSEQSDILPCLRVIDTGAALGQIARFYRQKLATKILALTGSAGKTTTKELLAWVLEEKGNVSKTADNLNNTIGVPLTVLDIADNSEFAIVEMGANAAGEIAFSVSSTQPDIAMLLNASEAHIEGFGDLDGVRKAKGEIFSSLTAGQIAIMNADDPALNYWTGLLADNVTRLTFGYDQNADYQILSATTDVKGQTLIEILLKNNSILRISLGLPGQHQVYNAAAVVTACSAFGINVEEVADRFALFKGVDGRQFTLPGLSGSLIIDDTYNASPASMRAAIDLIAGFSGQGLVLLGDMAELGEQSKRLHQEIVQYAELRAVQVLYFGPVFSSVAPQHLIADSHKDLVQRAREKITPGIRILVKGANAMNMKQVVTALTRGVKV